jgi:hypothetical protein
MYVRPKRRQVSWAFFLLVVVTWQLAASFEKGVLVSVAAAALVTWTDVVVVEALGA